MKKCRNKIKKTYLEKTSTSFSHPWQVSQFSNLLVFPVRFSMFTGSYVWIGMHLWTIISSGPQGWQVPNPHQQNHAAPQALIDSVNIWMATWLYNIILSENLASWILNPRSSKLETRPSRVETRSSHLETRNVWGSRNEDRVSSFELRVLTYYWAVL